MSAFGKPFMTAFPGHLQSNPGHSGRESNPVGQPSRDQNVGHSSANYHHSGSHHSSASGHSRSSGHNSSSNPNTNLNTNPNANPNANLNTNLNTNPTTEPVQAVDKNELMKAIESNSGRITYVSNSSNSGFMKVIMDGRYTGYNQCTNCTNKLSLIKSQVGGGVEHNLIRHNVVVHSDKSNLSAKGSFDYMMEKEDVIAAMYHEPEKIEYRESGHESLSGFEKVYHEGKYTGYMKCKKCETKVVLLKEKVKKDGTRYPGLFGVSNIMKHDTSIHNVKNEPPSDDDSDSNDSEASARKTRRLALEEFDKGTLLNLSDREIDRHIKELKVLRLRTDIHEKQSRMRESEERTKHYRRMDSKFDKLMKIGSDILAGINRLNEIQEGVKK